MDILDLKTLCYDYFSENEIKNRDELRQSLKTNPIQGVKQSFAENLFSMYKNKNKPKKKTNLKLSKTVCLSDMHIPNQDDKTCKNVFDCIVDLQPENLVLVGDIIDCYWNSKFLKNPKNHVYLQKEADLFYEIFSELRGKIKNTNMYFILGNHEERVSKDQWVTPQFNGLRALEPINLLKLDKLEIEFYPETLVLNGFTFTHGEKLSSKSSYTAKAELEAFQMNSGLSGHTHRLGSYYHTCNGNVEKWYENGCLCKLTPEYMKPSRVNWQQGFSIVNHYDGINQVEQILIQDHKFTYNGVVYK